MVIAELEEKRHCLRPGNIGGLGKVYGSVKDLGAMDGRRSCIGRRISRGGAATVEKGQAAQSEDREAGRFGGGGDLEGPSAGDLAGVA